MDVTIFENILASRPLSDNAISSLSRLVVDKSWLEINPEAKCAICHDLYAECDVLSRPLACDHIFHKHCLLTWFARKSSCPECRYNVSLSHLRSFADNFRESPKWAISDLPTTPLASAAYHGDKVTARHLLAQP